MIGRDDPETVAQDQLMTSRASSDPALSQQRW